MGSDIRIRIIVALLVKAIALAYVFLIKYVNNNYHFNVPIDGILRQCKFSIYIVYMTYLVRPKSSQFWRRCVYRYQPCPNILAIAVISAVMPFVLYCSTCHNHLYIIFFNLLRLFNDYSLSVKSTLTRFSSSVFYVILTI